MGSVWCDKVTKCSRTSDVDGASYEPLSERNWSKRFKSHTNPVRLASVFAGGVLAAFCPAPHQPPHYQSWLTPHHYSRSALSGMKCGRLRLQERQKQGGKESRQLTREKPQRYCQKRLVNPDHNEDPRWINTFQRFRCIEPEDVPTPEPQHSHNLAVEEDLFLSVQTLQLEGVEVRSKRPRTGFKYKAVSDGNAHRMFVKQPLPEPADDDDHDRSSQLTCYYYDDYAKYLTNPDQFRTSSEKSYFVDGVRKYKANKAVQVNFADGNDNKNNKSSLDEIDSCELDSKDASKFRNDLSDGTIEKISFHKSGKRKSLMISRSQSPETVQVIRVDVVCNYNSRTNSSHSHHEDDKHPKHLGQTPDQERETRNVTSSHLANKSKYHLTDTRRTLEENLSGGAKVTLLCKTFRLTDRSRILFNKKPFDIGKVTSKLKTTK